MEKFDFDFKSLLSLETAYGRKLVTVAYYVLTVAILINAIVSFIAGISMVATGSVLAGLGNIIFCVPLAVVYFIVLRVVCELVNAVFEHCGK
ncbi:MAG: DUF4282 domain-containing protein [Clostridia bacterium]|nr:DUF4282 domain-containing protein [Clostridia bacterium]